MLEQLSAPLDDVELRQDAIRHTRVRDNDERSEIRVGIDYIIAPAAVLLASSIVESNCPNLPSTKIFSMSAAYSAKVAKPCAASSFTA